MRFLDFIINFQFVIFPKFYTVKDAENNEYVFLRTKDEEIRSLSSVSDKTQLEAYENHVHLFGKVKKGYQNDAMTVANLITNNLVKELKVNFSNKKFHVYLDCDFSDHIIIRFHQHWKDEHIYYDVKEFSTITEYTIGM
ncbi:MAG: hypothetical protein HDR37_11865 [Treponema sp.]|nr:hypothetical protein [Treponema sp.]